VKLTGLTLSTKVSSKNKGKFEFQYLALFDALLATPCLPPHAKTAMPCPKVELIKIRQTPDRFADHLLIIAVHGRTSDCAIGLDDGDAFIILCRFKHYAATHRLPPISLILPRHQHVLLTIRVICRPAFFVSDFYGLITASGCHTKYL